MVFSYSFDSAIRLTLDEAQGKAQEYVLFVSTIASLLEHCASTPFRRFVANTLPPTPGPFTNTHAPACFTRTRSPFHSFLHHHLLLLLLLPFFSSFFLFSFLYGYFTCYSSSLLLFASKYLVASPLCPLPCTRKKHRVSYIIDIDYSSRLEIIFCFSKLHLFALNFFFFL